MRELLRKNWLKVLITVSLSLLGGFLIYDHIVCCKVVSEINYYLKASIAASSLAVIAMFTRRSLQALFDGPLTSAKALIIGIWFTYIGAFLRIITEGVPDAILARLEASYDTADHNSPLHWIHHSLDHILQGGWNLVALYLFGLGSFLILISSQNLSKVRLKQLVLWMIFIILIFWFGYNFGVLPYLGL